MAARGRPIGEERQRLVASSQSADDQTVRGSTKSTRDQHQRQRHSQTLDDIRALRTPTPKPRSERGGGAGGPAGPAGTPGAPPPAQAEGGAAGAASGAVSSAPPQTTPLPGAAAAAGPAAPAPAPRSQAQGELLGGASSRTSSLASSVASPRSSIRSSTSSRTSLRATAPSRPSIASRSGGSSRAISPFKSRTPIGASKSASEAYGGESDQLVRRERGGRDADQVMPNNQPVNRPTNQPQTREPY